MADCPKISRREIERTLVDKILVKKIMKIENNSQLAHFHKVKCRKNPVHDPEKRIRGNSEIQYSELDIFMIPSVIHIVVLVVKYDER